MPLKALPTLTKKNILREVNSLQIYEYYINKSLRIPTTIKSPLPSHTEKNPSFTLYGKNTDHIKWKDWVLGKEGNVFDFVMEMFNIDFRSCLIKINEDMRLGLTYHDTDRKREINVDHHEIPKRKNYNITRIKLDVRIKMRKKIPSYTNVDFDYWSLRHIEDIPYRLRRNRCYSTEVVFRNGSTFWKYYKNNPIYSYMYKHDDEYYWKCYRPLEKNKKFKFYNDMLGISQYCIHGLWYLVPNGDKLIITKSGKDCIALDELGFNVVAVQGESTFMSEDILLDLKSRFNDIYLLFDNDWNKDENWGQLLSSKVIEKHNFLKNIKIPDKYKCTDSDDLLVKVGKRVSKEIIENLL